MKPSSTNYPNASFFYFFLKLNFKTTRSINPVLNRADWKSTKYDQRALELLLFSPVFVKDIYPKL